jgi:hypothetical protein
MRSVIRQLQLVLLGIFLISGANATPIQWGDYTVPGVVTTSPGMHADQYGIVHNYQTNIDSQYMWYCGGLNTCSPSQGPNQVQFHQEFTVGSGFAYPQYWYGHGNLIDPNANPDIGERYALSIMADDYYALYINNQLVHYSWLNDGSGPNAPHFSDDPFSLTVTDLIGYLHNGQNVIDIIACNGNSGSNLPSAPSSTTDGGLDGCPNPSSYAYNWLLINGGFTKQDNTPGGTINANVYFISGDEDTSTFQVRAVPEPPLLGLLVVGFIGMAISKRRTR